MVVTLGQQYNVGEKPTVIPYTYINCHAGTLDKKHKQNRNNVVVVHHQTGCVCLFFPFILDIKFVERTSRGHTGGRSDRVSHPPSLSAVRALIFLARRIQPFRSLVDREVDFVY